MGKKKSLRLFHGTSSKHLPSILKKGLRGSPVFLTRSRKQAEEYALLAFNPFWDEKPVVLEFLIKSNKARIVKKDYFTVSNGLSPSHIIKVHQIVNR